MAKSKKSSSRKPGKGKGRSKSARQEASGFGWIRFFLTLGIWSFILVLAVVTVYSFDLPDLSSIEKNDRNPGITVLSEDGKTIATYGEVYGEHLDAQKMPPYLLQAVIATEDRRFYDHMGVDPIGIARAMFTNLRAGQIVQGGSTITQQLAKNLFLSPERTIKRKIQELLLSFWLEHRFTKDEILTLYLNRVYMGSGTYGVTAAAERFFHKPAQKLSLYESAIIAGLLKAPSRYSPVNNPKLARERANVVLSNMVDAGYIDQKQADKAKKNPSFVVVNTEGASHGGYYFADWVLDQIPDFIGHVDQDITVITTLDSHLQQEAEQSVAHVMDSEAADKNASQAALLSMSPDGAIRAMVGGRSYLKSQFNRATQAQRQPGSSFKLFVYAAAVEAGFLANDTMEDKPVHIGKWSPSNYDGRYRGTITLRDAFAHSVNTVAVQLSEAAGRRKVAEMAERLGITSPVEPLPSIALGTGEVNLLELTTAFAHFAHGGRSVWPYGISEIQDKDGNTLYKRLNSPYGQVLDAHVVATLVDLMRGVINFGTGGNARIGRDAAGKTGTSQDFRDAWFTGFTADLVTGVWVGNDNSAPMHHVTGGGLPARIWHDYMIAAESGLPARPITTYENDFFNLPSRLAPWRGSGENASGSESVPAPSILEPENGEDSDSILGKFMDTLSGEIDRLDDKVEYTYPTPKKR